MKDYNKIYELGSKIGSIKMKLENTDYKAIKYAEGIISKAEYEPIKIQREEWRKEIRALEAELSKLN